MLNELNDWADPDRGGRRRLMGESLLNSREFLMNAYFTDEWETNEYVGHRELFIRYTRKEIAEIE